MRIVAKSRPKVILNSIKIAPQSLTNSLQNRAPDSVRQLENKMMMSYVCAPTLLGNYFSKKEDKII